MANSSSSLRLLIVDDHLLFAEGLRSQLERARQTMQVVLATEGSKCMALAEREPHFDLIILDLYMPDLDGFEMLGALRQRGIESPVLMITAETSVGIAMRALEHGARGYLSKEAASTHMLEAVDQVLAGKVYLDPAIPHVPNEKPASNNTGPSVIPPRTLEVLRLVAKGHSNKRVADILNISPATVKWHVTKLFATMEVNNRTACVQKATRLGLIDPHPPGA